VLQFGATTKVGGWKTPTSLPQKDGKQRTRLATCWSATFVQLLLLIFFIVRLHLKYSANWIVPFGIAIAFWLYLRIPCRSHYNATPNWIAFNWRFHSGVWPFQSGLRGIHSDVYLIFHPCLIFMFSSVILCYLCFVISDSCFMGEERLGALNAIVAAVRTLHSHFSALMLRCANHKTESHNDKHFAWQHTVPRPHCPECLLNSNTDFASECPWCQAILQMSCC